MTTALLDAPAATSALVRFCRELALDDLPERVVAHTRRALLDFLALTVAGATTETAGIARATVDELGGASQARVPAFGDWTSVSHAALVAGVAGHVLDFDDTHSPTILHPTTPVLAAALPLAEWRGASGQALVEAYVAGVEAGARVALALGREHYDRGWHVTATAGRVGAAAAAARLLDLDHTRFTHALGAAATGAAGHREQFGWMTKSLHAGAAASNAVLCALLAARGYTASPESLEGRRGMLAVMSADADADALSAGLGQRWELDRTGFKPYACGVVTHPALDAMIRLRTRHGVAPEDLDEVVLRVHPLVQELTGKPAPTTGLEGKFSVTFAAAMALLEGAVGPAQFTDEAVRRPQVVAVQRRIKAVVDGSLEHTQAVLEARLGDGRSVTERADAARGTPENPMTDEDIRQKARDLVEPLVGAARATELIGLTAKVERLESVGPLVDATLPR